MRRIRQPIFDVKQALELCADSVRDKALSMRLLGTLEELVAAETNYKNVGALCQLFSIPATESVGIWVDGSEMEKIYTGTFARKNGPVRYVYDAIRASAPGGICPLCNQRPVSTLDHHLPKTKHPALAITPLNLVPACKDCNTDSRSKQPTSAHEQTAHPYFDSVDEDIWLVATVVQSAPPAIVFSVDSPKHWPIEKQGMMQSHFTVFGLANLYTTHAGGELVNIYFDIVNGGNLKSADDLKAHFLDLATNRRHVVKNSWQAALYQGLADSVWFRTGGYKGIASSPLLASPT